ncbi:hypothetical protein CDAR_519741 [Caerostris darwini]|uniref:Uncharacterized protein n=1 Tax=Caerostris darwini TaxID=1538125 RepID=A0AAV4TJE9_9ARAC|nr:hypothetical protein CDAR_519741 [Caerostris darwini]
MKAELTDLQLICSPLKGDNHAVVRLGEDAVRLRRETSPTKQYQTTFLSALMCIKIYRYRLWYRYRVSYINMNTRIGRVCLILFKIQAPVQALNAATGPSPTTAGMTSQPFSSSKKRLRS